VHQKSFPGPQQSSPGLWKSFSGAQKSAGRQIFVPPSSRTLPDFNLLNLPRGARTPWTPRQTFPGALATYRANLLYQIAPYYPLGLSSAGRLPAQASARRSPRQAHEYSTSSRIQGKLTNTARAHEYIRSSQQRAEARTASTGSNSEQRLRQRAEAATESRSPNSGRGGPLEALLRSRGRRGCLP